MTNPPVRLKGLILERHWQTHRTFITEYDKAARKVDPALVGRGPSRAQLHRWMSGELKSLPYSDHCRVLEKMFPGWTAEQLFERVPTQAVPKAPADDSGEGSVQAGDLLATIDQRLQSPAGEVEWGTADTPPAAVPPALLDTVEGVSDQARQLGRRLLELQQVLRLSEEETAQLAALSGSIVELSLTTDIDIGPDGWSQVTYRHQLLNLSDKPMTRLARDVWFEYTEKRLTIEPNADSERRIMIQRIHDTANLSKFACQISPPIQPAESATIAFTIRGGRFLRDHYWRQGIARYLRHYTLRVRHRGAGQLLRCTAAEEHPDGSENSAEADLVWDYDGDDVVMTLTRNYLRPNQALTLRWDVPHEPA
ncbi:hypothetical protein SAMN04489713_1176 [Actinomadura madurae]|uniref:Uncharacterized protein n=1 Tax=Actinomadura madurae TaxID=1993 RepID=A0A1I5SSL5_9ACTN|nr:hypothetical protein [Actinomadura madurae]SFP73723.1 hypothetical protein SAMN04489713_1176 [Actinomadura madurae]